PRFFPDVRVVGIVAEPEQFFAAHEASNARLLWMIIIPRHVDSARKGLTRHELPELFIGFGNPDARGGCGGVALLPRPFVFPHVLQNVVQAFGSIQPAVPTRGAAGFGSLTRV